MLLYTAVTSPVSTRATGLNDPPRLGRTVSTLSSWRNVTNFRDVQLSRRLLVGEFMTLLLYPQERGNMVVLCLTLVPVTLRTQIGFKTSEMEVTNRLR